MGDQRVPLTADQIASLNTQAVSLAEMSGSEIKRIVVAMLEADRLGAEPPMDIAGFMREPSAYDGSCVESASNAPDSCDQCGRSLCDIGYFFDACTIQDMMWSWMCPPCFFGLGCGVGEGWGQLYLREHGLTFLILGLKDHLDRDSTENAERLK
jgi:hypothetical protein